MKEGAAPLRVVSFGCHGPALYVMIIQFFLYFTCISASALKLTTHTVPILVAIISFAGAILSSLISNWKDIFPSPQTIIPTTPATESIPGSKFSTDRDSTISPNSSSQTQVARPPKGSTTLPNNNSKSPPPTAKPVPSATPNVSIGNENVAPTVINGSGNNVVNSIGGNR